MTNASPPCLRGQHENLLGKLKKVEYSDLWQVVTFWNLKYSRRERKEKMIAFAWFVAHMKLGIHKKYIFQKVTGISFSLKVFASNAYS